MLRSACCMGGWARAERKRPWSRSRAGGPGILVSTTVIEVGVDVSNATMMVVEQAERFGLSQLHQLRGRVGRGAEQSYCLLITEKVNDTAKERIRTLVDSQDGFAIAEMKGSQTARAGRVLRDEAIRPARRR